MVGNARLKVVELEQLYVNPSKTHLIIKGSHLSAASSVFGDTQVKITSEGRPHLGAALSTTSSFPELYVKCKVERWCEKLLQLCSIAHTHPQAAFAAFTHGLESKWTYLTRTMVDIGPLLQPLENTIRTKFIPAICGGPPPSDELRDLLALPCRLGGLGIRNPPHTACHEYSASKKVTAPIVNSILSHDGSYTYEMMVDQWSAVAEIKKRKHDRLSSCAIDLKSLLPRSSRPTESHGPLTRERGLQLADRVTYGGIWLLPSQGCLQRCPCFTVWMATSGYSIFMCLWVQLHSRECSFLPQRWIPIHMPQ